MPTKKLIPLNFNGKIDEKDMLKYRLRQFPCGEFEFSIQEKIDGVDIEIYQTFVYATHGILSGDAVEKLEQATEIKEITITNSLKQNCELNGKIKIIVINCYDKNNSRYL